MTAKLSNLTTMLSSASAASTSMVGCDDYVLVKRGSLVQGLEQPLASCAEVKQVPGSVTVTPGESRLKQPTEQTILSPVERKEKERIKLLVVDEMRKSIKVLKGLGALKIPHFKCEIHDGGILQTSASAGKYQLNWALTGGSTTASLLPNDVSGGGEWNSFNAVFSEFCVRKMSVHYEPNNQYLVGYASSTSTNLQTASATLASYQHDQPGAADGSSNFYQFMNASQHAVVHTGRPWSFEWVNIDKISSAGLAGQSTGWQGWTNMQDVTNFGGRVQIATAYPTGASPSSVILPESLQFGVFHVTFFVEFRYRD